MNNQEITQRIKAEFYTSSFQTILQNLVNDFKQEQNQVEKLILFENNRILKLNKLREGEKPTCRMCFGFPFPIIIEHQEIIYPNFRLSYYMQGEEVRKVQLDSIQNFENSKFEVLSPTDFKSYASKILTKTFDEFIFLEPYRFIGDSFIILQVADFFKSLVQVKEQKYFSYNPIVSGTFPFENSNPIDYLQNSNSENIFVVQPDFIDDQFKNTVNLISTISGLQKNVTLWVIGRNLIIAKEKFNNSIQIFKNNISDFVLWNENKEDMLQKSVRAFIDFLPLSNDKDDINNGESLINIYTSTPIKDINPLIVQSITNLEATKHSLLLDNENIKKQSLWENDLNNISFLHSFSLADTYSYVKKCQYIYTSDSAVAHIANRLNKHTVVFYNSERWDNDSFVSVIHHSLIGFASYKTNFFPIIINFGTFSEIEELSKFLFALQQFTTVSYSEFVINEAKKYVFSVRNNEYKKNVIARNSFLEYLSKILKDIELLEKYYFSFFTEEMLTCIEKNIISLRHYVEKLSPIYKIAKVISEE